jgi:hypothetical protein
MIILKWTLNKQILGDADWIHVAEVRFQWQALVNTVPAIKVLSSVKVWNFLTS